MDIQDVQLNHIPAVTEPVDENGLGQNIHDDIYSFEVTLASGEKVVVPNDSANANYWQVKEWYETNGMKPHGVTFEELPEPVFEETIYPEVEETEEIEVVETVAALDEPETLMTK